MVPFQNLDMLWLLVPVWLAWFFAEFFQEKVSTSLGNAMSNAIIILWGSIDCSRQTIRLIGEHAIAGFLNIFLRFFIITVIFAYGLLIIMLGWKGNKVIKAIGRIREITYVFVIFVPVFYNASKLTLNHLVAAVLFFPIFYFVIELMDRYIPDPKAVVEDMDEKNTDSGRGDLGSSSFYPSNTSSSSLGRASKRPSDNTNFKF
ncbi:MAG: hypothetical protein V1866_04345 [archaeon]